LTLEASCNASVREGATVTFNIYPEGATPGQDEPVETLTASVRQNRAQVELDAETLGRIIGRTMGELAGGLPGARIGEAIGRNIGRGLDAVASGGARVRSFFVRASSAGCEEVESEVVEVEPAPQGVIHIIPRFNQQGTPRVASGTVAGTWGGLRIARDQGRTGLLMSEWGCAVTLVANIAFTHDPQTTITPETIRQNSNSTDPNKTYFTGDGFIWWIRPLHSLGFRNRHIDAINARLSAAEFTKYMDDTENQYYVGINVNTTGTTGNSTTDHWVGASNLATLDDGIEYFRISPTSASDWTMRNPNGTQTGRAARGWRVENGNIYVPLTQLRIGYRVFTLPQG
jgi:hypothetical protein